LRTTPALPQLKLYIIAAMPPKSMFAAILIKMALRPLLFYAKSCNMQREFFDAIRSMAELSATTAT